MLKRLAVFAALTLVTLLLSAVVVMAATFVITPSNSQGWYIGPDEDMAPSDPLPVWAYTDEMASTGIGSLETSIVAGPYSKMLLIRPDVANIPLNQLQEICWDTAIAADNTETATWYLNLYIDDTTVNYGWYDYRLNFSPTMTLGTTGWQTNCVDFTTASFTIASKGPAVTSPNTAQNFIAENCATATDCVLLDNGKPLILNIGDTGGNYIGYHGYLDNIVLNFTNNGGTFNNTYDIESGPVVATVEEEASGPEWGDPFPCDAMEFVGGWGVFSEGTPAGTAFTVPEPPAGYAYANQPAHTGWCDVFTINDQHSPLPVTACWPGTAPAVGLYHDIPGDSQHGRTWSIIPTTQQGANVCASLPQLGGVALLTGGSSVGTMVQDPAVQESPAVLDQPLPAETPVDCMVTTTNRVNLRETPNGDVITRVPYDVTLTATAESNGWYQVDWLGQMGWISADYAAGECQ